VRTKGTFYKLDAATRVAAADQFAGRRVRVTVAPFRNSQTEHYLGTMLAGAANHGGTTTDVVVIRDDEGRAWAFSGATVALIETTAAKR
jgi:hypothetical protein